MNILHIFASKTWGGGEQYVLDIGKKLIEINYNVFFVSQKSEIIKNKTCNFKLDFISLRNLFDIFSIIKLSALLKKYDIDIVHIHNFKCAIIMMFAFFFYSKKNKQIKFIMTRHLVKKGKTNFIYNLLYKHLDKIIFVSKLAMDKFLSTSPNINLNKLIVIHNSILPQNYYFDINNINYRKKYNITDDIVILGYVGRLDKMKGVDVLLNALLKLNNTNYHLLIAGTGEYKQCLVNIVNDFGLNDKVTFLDFVENTTELMEQIDIGIVPSVWQEPFGLVLLEYMKVNKAIITTDNGAQKEFLDDNSAIFIPPNNSELLAQKIDYLIKDKEQRIKLGNNAKEKFDNNFNYNVFFDKIIKVYKSC